MKPSKDILRLISLTAALASILSVIFAYIKVIDFESRYLNTIMGGLLGALVSSYLAFFIRTLNKNPTPLKTAIIGLPRSGKTVYLSVLFNELQLHDSNTVSFQPYGRDTIEEVEKNIRTLKSGKWLRPTDTESVFYFRANSMVKGGFFNKKYTVEIGDYAGEKSKEFDSSSEEWLHKSDYFKYVITSDIILLAVDGALLAEKDIVRLEETQSGLVAAMQVLLDEKGISFGAPLEVPVALLILKSDLLTSDFNPFKSEQLTRIISLCKKHCSYFDVFCVSSVGRVDEKGELMGSIEPAGVTNPMIWALRKIRL